MFFPDTKEVTSYLLSLVTSNIGDWIVTGVITFISVRLATKKYYRQNTRALLTEALSNEVRRLMHVDATEKIPDSSLAVFVEYKGKLKKDMLEKGKDAVKGSPARRTIISIGGDKNNTSEINPRDYGVLGVANHNRYPALVDFQNQKVYYYHLGKVYELEKIELDNNPNYWGVNVDLENVSVTNHVVAKIKTHRGAMIALPIICAGKLVGGITFDVPLNSPAYKPIPPNADEEAKKRGLEDIATVLRQTNIVTEEIIKIYFRSKKI